MKDAAAALQSAAQLSKRRRCMVAVDEVPGFVRTVYTLLRVCDDSIIGWSEDGTQILIKEPDRFAAEVCPKFFRHRNFNSFTRLLNMYQFHKVPSVQRDSKDVCFEHPHFQRGRDDLLPLVQRKGAQSMRDELMALTQRLFRTFPNFKLRRRRLHETAPPRWRLHDHMRVDAPRECTEAVSRRCPCHTGPRDVRAAPVPGPGYGARPRGGTGPVDPKDGRAGE